MPNPSTFHRGGLSPLAPFPPYHLVWTPRSASSSVRISLSGQPGLGEAYPLRPAHPSGWKLGLPSSASLHSHGEGCPVSPAQHRRGLSGRHAQPKQTGTRRATPRPRPVLRCTGCGLDGKVSPRERVPDSPLGLPRTRPAPGRSARTSPARGTCPGPAEEARTDSPGTRWPALLPGDARQA